METTSNSPLALVSALLCDGLPSSMSRSIDLTVGEVDSGSDLAALVANADVILGDTYARKDELKALGCWFTRIGRDACWLSPRALRSRIYATIKDCATRNLTPTLLPV